MELKVVESKAERMKIEVTGETHTLLNTIRENAWKSGADQATYKLDHPYMSQPVISVRAKNPKKVLTSAAQMLSDDAKAFATAFKRASKK